VIYLVGKTVLVAFASLFPVINPVGTSLIFLTLTETADPQTRKILARKVALNTIAFLTVLLLIGTYLLAVFGISVPIIQAAGGLVLAGMGWKLINQDPGESDSKNLASTSAAQSYVDKIFYPLTFPITVGPGGIAVVLTLSAHTRQHADWMSAAERQGGAFIGIVLMGLVVYLSFIYADSLVKKLGPAGTKALMRMVAFLVICIGAEISWNGIRTLITLK